MSATAFAAAPAFPPLLRGVPVPARADPLAAACRAGADPGFEPGTVFYAEDDARFAAAILLAPDRPLGDAMGALLAVQLGLNAAVGALAPPEVGVHLEWPDRLRLNGALAGGFRAAAATRDPAAEPDWLAIGAELTLMPPDDRPGDRPDRTSLHEEGGGDVTAPALVEAFAHHVMAWLHLFMTEGMGPLHAEWTARGHRLGEAVDYPQTGRFLGLDERGGMLIEAGGHTRLLPLWETLT